MQYARGVRSRAVAIVLVAGCGFSGKAATSDAGPDPTGDGAPPGEATIPWLDGYSHRRAITIRGTAVDAEPSGPLRDFPVMIALDERALGTIALPDRTDLAFTRADATTRLDHEIETDAADAVIAWIKLPELPAGADTTIFVYYGNSAPPPVDPTRVWTAGYRAVYHLNQNPDQPTPGAILDATSSLLHGTADSSLAAESLVEGLAGRGIRFDGSNGCITIPAIDVGSQFTISVWSRMDNIDRIRTVLSNSEDGSTTNGFRFFLNSNGQNDRRIHFETGNGGTTDPAIAPNGSFAHEVFAHVAVAVDRAAGTALIYVDGKFVNPGDVSVRTDFNTSSTLELGRMKTNNEYAGILDQLEIATTVRSAAWLHTTAVNQGMPDTFYVIGDAEVLP